MIQEGPYYFEPRVKDGYRGGWEGYRTLVLGIFHVCTSEECEFRAACMDDCLPFDKRCPSYVDKDEYYRLSNSNEIEIESYLEDAAQYPTYTNITKYLLHTNKHVTESEKRPLWDAVAFTNFIQRFQGAYDTMYYGQSREKFDTELPAFVKVLHELSPEVIYVIDTAVTDCLMEHLDDIPGLKFEDENQNWALPIYRFTYNVSPKGTPEEIIRSFESIRKATKADNIRKILNAIECAKDRSKLIKCDDPLVQEVLPHIWDEKFVDYLNNQPNLSARQKAQLKQMLKGLNEQGCIVSPDSLVFKKDHPKFRQKYMRDGLFVEIVSKLNEIDKDNKVDEYRLLCYLGIRCNSQKDWRTSRKKEYTDRCREAIKENKTNPGDVLRRIVDDSLKK